MANINSYFETSKHQFQQVNESIYKLEQLHKSLKTEMANLEKKDIASLKEESEKHKTQL